MTSTLGELLGFFWSQKLWWLIPMLCVLFVLAVLIVLGSVGGVGPFVYTLL
jgi:hypothetical protein